MKDQYLKWISKNIAKDYRERYRHAIKTQYDPSCHEDDRFYVTWVCDEIPSDDEIACQVLDLIDEAIRIGCKFGDFIVRKSQAGDGIDGHKKYPIVTIILLVG